MNHETAVDGQLAERYLLNELNEEECRQFEEHYFTCTDCADNVRASFAFIEGSRVLLREQPAAAAAPPGSGRSWWSWLWAPAPAYAMAGLLAAALVFQQAGGLGSDGPQAHLLTTLRPVTRGTTQTVGAPAGQRWLHLAIIVPAGTSYICTFSRAGVTIGEPVRTPVLTTEQLSLALPVETFSPGDYRLDVKAADAGQRFQEEFAFTIQR